MDEARIALSNYRIEQAWRYIRTAESNMSIGDFASAANRSYYSIFQSMRAVLALDGVNFRKHSAVISFFRREYIKTGVFDIHFSDIIGDAFSIRGDSDYEDFYVISGPEVEEQISNAKEFYSAIKAYLDDRISRE